MELISKKHAIEHFTAMLEQINMVDELDIDSVCYPTLVYFKREKDCKEAYNIMKSLGKLDDLYTDF